MKSETFTIAFYNLENLFDTINDPDHFDDDFTPDGTKKWTLRRYKKKIKRLAKAISTIGNEESTQPPVIIGVAEVENFNVVTDLIQDKHLIDANYDIVHYDSPDERGIEVAFLYRKKYFELLDSKPYPISFKREDGSINYTRDVLYVKGRLNGELIHFLVNHWPSRRSGTEESEYRRIAVSELNQKIIKTLNPDEKCIVMGDFNDNPIDTSIKNLVNSGNFINPMKPIFYAGKGTSNHHGDWYLFDQIIYSKNFNLGTNTFKDADIYCKHFLKDKYGKYIEDPFRTYRGRFYKGGISDHFPVYITLEKHN